MSYVHRPVLLAEVLAALQPAPGKVLVDGTVGGGGHAASLLPHLWPGGFLVGIDADPAALAAASHRLESLAETAGGSPGCYRLLHGNASDMGALLTGVGVAAVDGVLLDLGVSSHQLDTPERGFSFLHDGPLDMRMDPTQGETAAELLAQLDERELADVLYHYGEERLSRRIARRIVERQQETPLETTRQLADLVARAAGGNRGRHRIHPATRTFQALRIAVNRELDCLAEALRQAVALLRPGGSLAVISFHSLEDRLVKQFFRAESGYGGNEAVAGPVRLRILTRKPVEASDDEVRDNPRSRSAKLRVAERIEEVSDGL